MIHDFCLACSFVTLSFYAYRRGSLNNLASVSGRYICQPLTKYIFSSSTLRFVGLCTSCSRIFYLLLSNMSAVYSLGLGRYNFIIVKLFFLFLLHLLEMQLHLQIVQLLPFHISIYCPHWPRQPLLN